MPFPDLQASGPDGPSRCRQRPLRRAGRHHLLERHPPIDASSGEQIRHRLSRVGNRQINRVLHIMATVQLPNPPKGTPASTGRRLPIGL
ncbi:transposase [Micromonospora sp. NPDC007230]|uniref:transposase n=1 Tax=Micromonospora sp. NPDC007230 TaxID=3364237 RepID=UPI00367B3320